jgi:hypothetical protein
MKSLIKILAGILIAAIMGTAVRKYEHTRVYAEIEKVIGLDEDFRTLQVAQGKRGTLSIDGHFKSKESAERFITHVQRIQDKRLIFAPRITYPLGTAELIKPSLRREE